MSIQFRCNACGETLSVGDKMAGRSVDCPGCGAPVRVPDGEKKARPAATMPQRQAWTDDESSEAGSPVPPPLMEFAAVGGPANPELAGEPAAPPQKAPPRQPKPDMGGFNMGMARPTDQEEMDLTPMVDMTFLLLIFFMITASFSVQKSMGVPPPSSDKKGAAQSIQSLDDLADTSIAVRIDERNVIFIDDDPVPGSMRLTDVLLQKFSAQRNELLLTADDGALHDTVIAVIDAANEIGVQKIRMTSAARD
ncbi:MAG: biopolymer transporter ExbD [Planctomycetota bacterium]|nr:biopolymer transporter ExbD [Planctomycetota bacterium]